MTKPKTDLGIVGVLMGGCSSEREISFKSGRAVVEALKKMECSVKPIEIDVEDNQKNLAFLRAAHMDVAFVALHGAFGEDGRIQSILEELKIPYTGSGVEASHRAFNKAVSQTLFHQSGLPVPEFKILSLDTKDELLKGLGTPLVVKPACEGSSIGITIVDTMEDLPPAVNEAFKFGPEVLVEQFIVGREVTVGVLHDQALPIVEIKTEKNFFDFQSKYQKGLTEYLVPAPLNADVTERIQQLAVDAHRLLGCYGYSRVDFRLDKNNNPFILEVNTIPGFTETSLYPKAARQAGVEFSELCVQLLELAYGKGKKI